METTRTTDPTPTIIAYQCDSQAVANANGRSMGAAHCFNALKGSDLSGRWNKTRNPYQSEALASAFLRGWDHGYRREMLNP